MLLNNHANIFRCLKWKMPKEQLTYMHLYIYSISFTLLNPCKFFVKKQSETFFSEDFIFLSILSESSKQRNVCQVSSCQTFTRNLSNDLSLQRLRNKRYWKLFHVKIYLRQKFLQRKVWTAKNLYGKKSHDEQSLQRRFFIEKYANGDISSRRKLSAVM